MKRRAFLQLFGIAATATIPTGLVIAEKAWANLPMAVTTGRRIYVDSNATMTGSGLLGSKGNPFTTLFGALQRTNNNGECEGRTFIVTSDHCENIQPENKNKLITKITNCDFQIKGQEGINFGCDPLEVRYSNFDWS